MKGHDNLSRWLRKRIREGQESEVDELLQNALAEGQLFDWESLTPLLETSGPLETEFFLFLLAFLNVEDQSTAELLDAYPVLLVEESSYFLNAITAHYSGDRQKEERINDRRALLQQRQQVTGVDYALFDYATMDGHLSATPVDFEDMEFGTLFLGDEGNVIVIPVDLGDDEADYLYELEEEVVAHLVRGDLAPALEVIADMHDEIISSGQEEEETVERLFPWMLLFADLVEHAQAEGALWHRTMIADALPSLTEEFPLTLLKLADDYVPIGKYQQARKLAQFALFINQHLHGDKHLDTIFCLEYLADLYRTLGNIEAALAYDNEALLDSAFLDDNPHLAATTNRAIRANRESNNHDFAMELVQRAQESAAAPEDVATTNHLSALLHLDRFDYQTALSLAEQAVQMRGQIMKESGSYDESVLNYAASLHLQAVILREMGEYSGALPLIEQALTIREDELGRDNADFVSSLSFKAVLQQNLGNYLEAMSGFRESTTAESRSIVNVFPTSSDYERKVINQQLRTHFHLAMSCFVAVNGAGLADAAPVAFALTLHRKGIEAEMSRLFRASLATDPVERARLGALQNKIGQLALAGESYEITPDDLPGFIIGDYRGRRQIMEMQLAADIADELEEELAQLFMAATLEHIVEQLADDEVLVEFVQVEHFDFAAVPLRGEAKWLPAFYLALVINPGRPEPIAIVKLGEAETIDDLINSYRLAISGTGGPAQPSATVSQSRHISDSAMGPEGMKARGQSLRQAVFDPLLPALDGRKRLIIVPDGDLARLPFESLPGDDGRYLIDDYSISYLGSSRDLLNQTEASTEAGAPLVLANPDFDLSGDRSATQDERQVPISQSHDLPRGQSLFDPLPGSAAEGMMIADMLGVTALLGRSALEGQVKQAHSPRVLHLATHAFFLPNQATADSADAFIWQAEGSDSNWGLLAQVENPLLRSGLAMAGANTWLQDGDLPEEAEDGLLTAEDVTTMDLTNADLIVLSACETGLGDIQVGEGVFGLRRAFVLAGARTLVMSLWKVPDQQTQELMVDFYKRILDTQPRGEALRQAQLALKERYPEPYYWGAFICQGDPGPLNW